MAHAFQNGNLGGIGETHGLLKLEDELCVSEDLCSYFVLIACALERSQHAA